MQCTAKSKRSGERCLRWAVRGRKTCHMHGGLCRGPQTQAGKKRSRLAALRHGGYTKETQAQYRKMRDLIRQSKNMLDSFS